MYLLWLRVAAIFYAGGCVAVFPAVLSKPLPWRKTCVHLGGMAFFFHFVSVVEMLVQAHRWMPVGVREIESLLGFAVAGLFFLVWWLYDAISLGIFALPATFFLVFIPALGPDRYRFPSQGVRISWLVAHIIALLLAYAALCFSLLASVLYLVQERRIKAKPKPGKNPLGSARLAAAARHAGADCPRHAGIRLSVHDGGTGDRLRAGAGNLSGRGLFSRSQCDCFLRHVAGLCAAAAGAPRHGIAGTQGGLCLGRGAGRDDGRLGR